MDNDRSLVVEYLPTNDIGNQVSMISLKYSHNRDVTTMFKIFDIYFWISLMICFSIVFIINSIELKEFPREYFRFDYVSKYFLHLFEPLINKTSKWFYSIFKL